MFGQKSSFGSESEAETKSVIKTLKVQSEIYRKTLVNAQSILRELQSTHGKFPGIERNRNFEESASEKNLDAVKPPGIYANGGLLDKLKTLKQKIAVQRGKIFAVYQQISDLRKVEILKLRKCVSKNCPNTNQNVPERDAIGLLPEEVWKKIMQYLTEIRDLQASYRTCTLFWNILNETKDTWLFPMVYPHLINYLNKSDINTCRLISKRWSSMVNSTRPRSLQLNFPLKPSARTKLEKFNGVKSDDYLAKYNIEILAEADNETVDPDDDTTFREICQFLTKHGSTITNLELELMTDQLNMDHVAGIIIKVLEMCTQLERFKIRADAVLEDELFTSDVINELLPQDFKVPTTLRTLDIWSDTSLAFLQTRILQDCQPHLQEFLFDDWTHLENDATDWSSLTKLISRIELHRVLESTKQMNVNFFNHLIRSSMPNLLTLQVSVMKGVLEKLLQTSNRCPKLENLALNLYQPFLKFSGFLSKEYLEIPEGVFASATMKKIEMNVLLLNGFLDLSLLLFFPFVETLEILLTSINSHKDLSKFGEYPSVLLISELLAGDKVYMSDIWKFLPFLKQLKIDDRRKIVCYTRAGYNTYVRQLNM